MSFERRLQIALMWQLPQEVFEWIEDNIPYGSRVLEFGSGIGTVRLCRNYMMTSVEHDEKWLDKAPSTYIHAPLKNGWYDVDIVSEALKGQEPWDLIIIDGPNILEGKREIFLDHFKDMGLNCGCPFIVDDTIRAKGISESLETLGYSKQTIKLDYKACNILVKEQK